MSNTLKNNGYGFFRKPRTQNSRVTEQLAKQEILEAGYRIHNRLQTRANLYGPIPTAYDDLNYSTRTRY
jgi:hypothetical protein